MIVDSKSISQQPVGQRRTVIAKQAVSQSGIAIGQQLVAQYRRTESLPEQLKSSLSSIEIIEAELERLK